MTLRERLAKSCMRDGAVEVRSIELHDEVMPGPVLLVPSTLVATQAALRSLLDEDARPQVRVAGKSFVARFSDVASIPAEALADPEGFLAARGRSVVRGPGTLLTVTDKATAREAENALLQSLRKSVDGLISRTINRPMSLATTRYLARTTITPNQWTVVTAILGVLGAVVMAQGGYLLLTLGALMVHLSSVLDGCDGELARIKFKSSKIGEWLDTIADDVVNSSMILGLGFGITASTGSQFYATLSIIGWSLYIAYTAVVYHHLITRARTGYALDFKWWFEEGNSQANTMSGKLTALDIVKLMLRRDFFVFAFFVLTAVTLPQVALWLAFIGAVITFVLGSMQAVIVVRGQAPRRRPVLQDAE